AGMRLVQTLLFENERRGVLVDIVLRDQDAVEELLFLIDAGLAGLDEVVGLLDGSFREHGNRLQNGVLQFAGLDGCDRIRRTVETANLDLIQLASLLQGGNRAQSHFVVTGDNADNVRVDRKST